MSLITAPRVEGTVTVSDDRRLGFAEFGPAHGRPVLWMHGTPGARRQVPEPARLAAAELGVRIISVDRPGVGWSKPHLYANVLDFTNDLQRVLDNLRVDDFAVTGLSGGGPYVLATAYAMPDRVAVGGVLGGVAPTQGPDAIGGGVVGRLSPLAGLTTAFRTPLSVAMTQTVRALRPVSSPLLDLYARISPEGDRQVFARPEMKAMFLDDIMTNGRRGMGAFLLDFIQFCRPWGFELRDVSVPIRWWHGDSDHIVPLVHGEHVVSRLPDATLTVRPGESHLGGLGIAEEVLGTLLDVWDRRHPT